ncbi:MAG: hypothetical protein DRI57_21210 [Deltaproteobacteria bacterium]|nr:MAG: hypothetical protein DRI57_21210 [Deltaproteobacteria bacterium]
MFLKELFRGIGAYGKANRLISRHKLWPYVTIPGIMSLCYMFLLISMGIIYFDEFSAYINEEWIPNIIRGTAMLTITSILIWVLMLLIGYMTYKHIVLILFSPILSYVSEITEEIVYRRPSPPFSFRNFVKDIFRGLVINVRNLILTVILTFMAWLLIFMPVVGAIISTILIFLIQFFYAGFGLMDYTLERKRYSVRESVQFARCNRARVIGVGIGFMLLMMIPVIGWFTAPAYGTIAATLATLEKINGDDPQLRDL